MGMADALLELENILRKEDITSQEVNELMQWKSNALRDFTLGATAAATVGWFATGKLHNVGRLLVTAGGSFYFGLRLFGRSLDSSFNHVLSLDGTRMQRELGVLMLRKYQDDPIVMQRVSKHFYSEEVYDDSSDRPRLRWRFRNFFGENAAYSPATEEHASNSEKSDQKRTIPKMSNLEPKQAQMSTASDAVESPFDSIFGIPAEVDEKHHTGRSKSTSKKHAHGSKRSHRRHRKRQLEASEA